LVTWLLVEEKTSAVGAVTVSISENKRKGLGDLMYLVKHDALREAERRDILLKWVILAIVACLWIPIEHLRPKPCLHQVLSMVDHQSLLLEA